MSGAGLLAPLLPAGEPVERVLRRAQFFVPGGRPTADFREVHRAGGRGAEEFYRDRWRHDKVVRSTHGVNCTGSCSWQVYVKDGIITWETQQTDYPSAGPDSPEYEPRGCPRGASFSWYTYSPARIRYPYVRGVLLQAYRQARARLGDPVAAWAEVTGDPQRRRGYQRARGKAASSGRPGTKSPSSSPPPTCTRSRRTGPTGWSASPRSRRCRRSPTPRAPASCP